MSRHGEDLSKILQEEFGKDARLGTNEPKGATRFGCAECWPQGAEPAWEARRRLAGDASIVNDTHFIVRIVACTGCGQRFLSMMTEMIDWDDGDDPQHWVLIPVTPEEACTLVVAGEDGLRGAFDALDRGRRSLHRDAPKGRAVTTYWGCGIRIMPHD